MFCCCLCGSGSGVERPQQVVIRKFKKWLDKKGNQSDALDNVMRLFTEEKDAVESLESCRLNPDFTESIRTDLEFYIPQLLSYYLWAECDEARANDLALFIVMACKSYRYFSHRVMFFLFTFSNSSDPVVLQKVERLFQGISQFARSEGPLKNTETEIEPS